MECDLAVYMKSRRSCLRIIFHDKPMNEQAKEGPSAVLNKSLSFAVSIVLKAELLGLLSKVANCLFSPQFDRLY